MNVKHDGKTFTIRSFGGYEYSVEVPRDGKRDPRVKSRDEERRAARRAKHTTQGR